MTKAWNTKEQQLLDQTGEGTDLNGDGYVGDAPTGNACGGSAEPLQLGSEQAKSMVG